ncbi:MAG: hypothetical protein JXA18_01705 [Chitinispirillaceae bacterium]|nr:hypothetical protein [Chitinispirillaceae bacterium]
MKLKGSLHSHHAFRSALAPVTGVKPFFMLSVFAFSFTAAPVDTAAAADTAVSSVDTIAPVDGSPVSTAAGPASSADSPSTALPGITEDSSTAPHRAAPVVSPASVDTMQKPSFPVDTSTRLSRAPPDTSAIDTTVVKNGFYVSAGIGWSLGGFSLFSLWENALPDSLESLGLTASSFSIPYDTAPGAEQPPGDTALLTFSVKERPAVYTMCFPLSLSLVRLGDNNRFAFSLYGSWMRKIFAATIAAAGDSLARKADYRERMNVFSAFFSFAYGRRIPAEYFSIREVQSSYFTAAVEIAPLIACTIRRSVSSPASDKRFGNLHNSISSPSQRFLHGSAAALRLGLSLVKRLNRNSAIDFGIWYCIQGYGYFLEDGGRVRFTAVDPDNHKKGRPLYWTSNRLEISAALMRLHKK